MSTSKTQSNTTEIDKALAMIGDVHILCIIHHLSTKEMRFNELQRAIDGISPTTLTDILKRLEKENLILRKEETLDKISVVYALTDKGRGLVPVINEVGKFAMKYVKS
jgi:DNA-binding HxlR family transcriptional regulator